MKTPRIGFTHGDINGIGYEVLLKMLQDAELLDFCTPVIFGSPKIAQATMSLLSMQPIALHIIENASEAIDGRINLVSVCKDDELELQLGQQTEPALQAEAQSLIAALDASAQRYIDALVALPGHLDNLDGSHSLTDFVRRALNGSDEVFDWILNEGIRAMQLHHTDVSTELGEGLAAEAFTTHVQAISQSLRQDFKLMRPRIAVVSPVTRLTGCMDELHELGVFAFGPFDVQKFAEGRWQQHYDGCLFVNTDIPQQQILEDCEPQHTIGYISGLPLVLTYPLQTISYSQAGRGEMSEVPLREALYAAIDILRSRIAYHHATKRPLERQWVPRGRDDFKLDLTKED